MDTSFYSQHQLLATKFFAPVTSGTVISRSRLTTLLDQCFRYPLMLISAPAGFGKTTLLSAWVQSLPAGGPRLSWVSLDEEDNDARQFWTYILTALSSQQPERFAPLLMSLQLSQDIPLKYILKALINLLAESTEHFVLILDDYQMITQSEIHTALSYLVEYLPPQGHIILATRTDLPLPLALLQARQQVLEVRTDQLRCTTEEARTFFKEAMGIQLSDETIREITARTEGWLVGLQLLGLSLLQCADPTALLEEVTGDQSYILDYLTEVVLKQQPQEVQTFLLYTCILDRLTARLCDAVMNQTGSQQILEWLDRANLFVVSLDGKREWYRYHTLFAEALHYHLEQMYTDLMPLLHYRASLWYAEHDQNIHAVLHALHAKEWQWAAGLMERVPFMSLVCKADEHRSSQFQRWLEQLPTDIIHSRPRLCLACNNMLWAIAPQAKIHAWLDAAEATLMTSLTGNDSSMILTPQARQDQENLLGEVLASRAWHRGTDSGDPTVLPLCQKALSLLSVDNYIGRIKVACTQSEAAYTSEANDAVMAIQSLQQALPLAQTTGQVTLVLAIVSMLVRDMIGGGRLHEAQRLLLHALELGKTRGELRLPEVGWPALWHAEILRERNELDAALPLAEEALSLCKQTDSVCSLVYILLGYVVLLRVFLSRRELDAARSTLQQFERIGTNTNPHTYIQQRSFFTIIDQVRLWLACGELEYATRWVKQVDLRGPKGTPFAQERQEVACVRVLLANNQPVLALQRLESVLERATMGQRWGHVIEMLLLQALAYQMCYREMQAFSVLSKALDLAEPEGYIRSFLDEGVPMATLLYQLRKRQRENGPTPYLDSLLAAFQQENMADIQSAVPTKTPQRQPAPLSKRELEILQLLARGASNQEIAQNLVIAYDTVKRHVSNIFSKLGAQNRVQAVKEAQALGLLGKEL